MAITDFRQHLEVETPEHVVLDYEIAGIGSRGLASLIDHALLFVWILAMSTVIARFTPSGGGEWLSAIMVLFGFISLWSYFTFFEGLRAGQTPGKRWLGIRVVQDTGHALTLGSAVARNLLRVADFLPLGYLLGGVFVAIHPRGKRLGDIVAATVVVRDQPQEAPQVTPHVADEAAESAGAPELSDEEFHFLREFAERAAQLTPQSRARVAGHLAERLAPRYPNRVADTERFLSTLYQDELARRRGRFAARSRPAGGGATGGGAVAERLVARKSARWEEFQAMADRAARQGLDSFAAAELPDFAARYREVAADLARARTYRAAPNVLSRLERLVAAGHNTLYRDERRTGQRAWQFLLRECPAGIIEARRAVLLAFLLFALPALGGYVLLREQPALAQEVLPETMLERAEAGHARQLEGKGYVEEAAEKRPLMASYIMTNNIRVAFSCFAGGIFAGVGSLVLLAFNGLSIGAISGHFANVGLLGYLWTFVIGHGVLELFAIWVAGAAGFLLGKAFISPGELSRGEALALAGRLAMRMIGAVVVLLVIAGLIEGFVSASGEPLAFRLAVSGASVVFLLAYLANGWAWLRRRPEQSV
ncbi:MAG: stage II sporulation protein M [Gemmatimonadales bacterium]